MKLLKFNTVVKGSGKGVLLGMCQILQSLNNGKTIRKHVLYFFSCQISAFLGSLCVLHVAFTFTLTSVSLSEYMIRVFCSFRMHRHILKLESENMS